MLLFVNPSTKVSLSAAADASIGSLLYIQSVNLIQGALLQLLIWGERGYSLCHCHSMKSHLCSLIRLSMAACGRVGNTPKQKCQIYSNAKDFFYLILFFKWNNTVYKEEAIKRRTVGYIGSNTSVTNLLLMQLSMAHLKHINSGVYMNFIYSFIKKNVKYFF